MLFNIVYSSIKEWVFVLCIYSCFSFLPWRYLVGRKILCGLTGPILAQLTIIRIPWTPEASATLAYCLQRTLCWFCCWISVMSAICLQDISMHGQLRYFLDRQPSNPSIWFNFLGGKKFLTFITSICVMDMKDLFVF